MILPLIGPAAGIFCIMLFGVVACRGGSTLVAWGDNFYGQTDIPPRLTNVVEIAGSSSHSLALSRDGTVAAWGWNTYGQADVPPGLANVKRIGAGSSHSLAVTAAGTVRAWGWNFYGQTDVPAGLANAVAIAGGSTHSLALKADGTVVGWGNNLDGQRKIPNGLTNVVAIAAGGWHSLALLANGRIVAWGYNGYGQTDVPTELTNVVAIAAGASHSLALRADGRVVVWGNNDYGQRDVPVELSNVVAIAGGSYHCLALKSEGRVAAWGYNGSGQTNVPGGLTGVVAIAPRSLTVVGDGAPFLTEALVNRVAAMGGAVSFRATASGLWPLSFQWRFNGTNVADATNAWVWLENVQAGQAGLYSVVVSNALDVAASSEARLEVAPLWISWQPESQLRVIRETASFDVAVESVLPVSYQWRLGSQNLLNDSRISGASTPHLSISNVQFSDAGEYLLVASNALGAITSQVALLMVTNYPPVLTCQPQSQEVDANASVSFSVCVESIYPFHLQWVHDGEEIPWANSSSYVLPSAWPTNDGNYWCIASNQDGVVTSGAATLKVWPHPPTIVSNPQSATVIIESITGNTYYLDVIASGTQPLSYQWYTNGEASTWPGARTSLLRIPRAAFGGTYNCQVVVTNNYGAATSSLATVSFVYQPPQITNHPVSRTVEWGFTNIFFVDVSDCLSPLSYQWLHNGQNIPGAIDSNLILGNVTTNEAGNYQVIVSNYGGTVTSEIARLEVLMDPPRFAQAAQNQSLQIGGWASFSCVVTGALPLSLQWRLNGEALAGQTNTSLAFQFTNRNQIGVYSLVASNLFGAATNEAALRGVILGVQRLLSSGEFEFAITNQLGGSCRIQASEDLIHWDDIFSFSNKQATTVYIDPDAYLYRRLFYRVVSP